MTTAEPPGEPHVALLDVRDDAAVNALIDGVRAYNTTIAGSATSYPLLALARSHGTVIGGVAGRTIYGHWLIEVVWVAEHARRRGLGRSLMRAAEDEALRRGVRAAQVDTLSFQALGFYQRLGFREVGRIDDFPPGHSKHFLVKHYAPQA